MRPSGANVGKTADEVTSTLVSLGLKPVVVPDDKSDATAGSVISQLPEPGSNVPPDSEVAIVVAGAGLKPTPY